MPKTNETIEAMVRDFTQVQPRSKSEVRERILKILAIKDAECEERVKKIEKAYGGCHYCYGKGYGTQTAAWEGRGYYKKLPTMKFCSCERGGQLKSLLTPPLPDQGDSK